MAKVDNVTGETIERLRGIVDFYMYKGKIPVARKWPKKPTPPYTALQAEAMLVFKIASACFKKISDNMLEEWRKGTEGKREQWTDVFRGIIMKYWKIHKSIAPIATDYNVEETDTQFKISWDILEVFIDPNIPEKKYTISTTLINKSDIEETKKPVYFTLFDDEGTRLVAPYILFEV